MATVLVYGGTGSQARPTVTHLKNNGHMPIVVSRSLSDEEGVVQGDLSDLESLKKINQGIDMIAFLLPAFLGPDDDAAEMGRNAIDAAVAAGVSKFVWNASGPIPNDDDDAKKQILNYLKSSGLEWVVFEPTTYMENWLGPWTAPFVKNTDEISYPVLTSVKMGWIASDDVGKLVVAALTSNISGKRFDISGTESPKGAKLAEIYSRALGRDISYRTMPPKEMGKIIDQAFGPGVGDRIAEMYRAEQEDPNPEPKFYDMTAVLEIFPVKMTTIEQWVKTNREAFNK